MENLQRVGGMSAILNAMIYIAAFTFFGAVWDYPKDADSIAKLAFLAEHQIILTVVYFTIYVVFGVLLAFLVLAIYRRLEREAPILSQAAAVFGIIWVGLVIASGMVANIGLATVVDLSVLEPERAMTILLTINAVVSGLGGDNEIVGGLWLLLLSLAAIKAKNPIKVFPKALNYLGILLGIVGILTVYPADVLKEIFGIGQIVWFIWIGIVMCFLNSTYAKQK